jgi:hypothetical protein
MHRYIWLLSILLSLSLGACRKKELPSIASTTGAINVRIQNMVDTEVLVLNRPTLYALSNGDSFSVSTYNYYLSNFVFTDEHGNQFAEQESYHLVRASDTSSLHFTINNVPFEQYASVEFLIGVDSVRNFSGAQSGALDPGYGMIWSWNTGYIMAKMEGHSPQVPTPDHLLSFHIAGYKGQYNVLQKVKINLNTKAIVSSSKTPIINMQSDLATWFTSFTFPGFAKLYSVGSEGINAYSIAQSYSNMMKVTTVENP